MHKHATATRSICRSSIRSQLNNTIKINAIAVKVDFTHNFAVQI